LKPVVSNLNYLLKQVIQKAGLKKYKPDLLRSIKGGFFIFQRDWGSYPSEGDLNPSIGGLSAIAIWVLIGSFILLILFILVSLYSQGTLKYLFPLQPCC